MSDKIRCIATKCGICNISVVVSYENGELRLKLSFLVITYMYIRRETTNWTSIRIVIMKRKYTFEVETPPQHPLCPPMRYFKPMEAVSFVYFNEEMVLFSVSA